MIGEAAALCVVAEPFRPYEVQRCFDATHGYILSSDSKFIKGTERTEWSDHIALANYYVPRLRREFRNGDLRTEVIVREATLLSSVDPALFVTPAGAQEISGCYEPTPPKDIEKPEPSYTSKARKKKVQGWLSLDVQIGGSGLVENAFIVESLEPTLDRTSIDTVKKKWRFEPSTCSGVPVPNEFVVEVSFNLF
jgi:TonB family protein